MPRNVKLYALSTCGWCKKTHFFLEDNGIEHEVIAVDLLEEKEKEQVRNELGRHNPRKSYPTIVIDDRVAVVGFEEEKLRQVLGLSQGETPQSLMERMEKEAEATGYFFNPDTKLVLTLMEGLLKNNERYGYQSCPCMESYGSREQDRDIICPCDYRDADLAEFGACYCALYVTEEIAQGKKKAVPIPLRRPEKNGEEKKPPPETVPSSGIGPVQLPADIWRCKVCGYLCAMENPPQKCPICGADKDRFEVFLGRSA